MIRTVVAVAAGFVLGWATAVVQGLLGSKFQGPRVRKLAREYAPSGISADKLQRMWAEDDRHDVLPTDDELTDTEREADRNAALNTCCRAKSEWNYLCSRPTGHTGIHIAEGTAPGEVYDSWFV